VSDFLSPLNLPCRVAVRFSHMWMYEPMVESDLPFDRFSRVLKKTFVCLFLCLFLATRAIFQLSFSCHHCRWKGCKLRPMLSTHGFHHWGFFYVPHLLRQGTSIYTVTSEGLAPTSHMQWDSNRRHRSNHCINLNLFYCYNQIYKQRVRTQKIQNETNKQTNKKDHGLRFPYTIHTSSFA
jgi:hypothetical protein